MSEHAVSFAGGRLLGVLTEPDPARARKAAPTVVSSNVGVNHHVGPYRFFVDLSRALADRGFASLRFDQSGFGNSAARKDTLPALERAKDDHVEAMKFLATRRGSPSIAAVGFCSSVDVVHRLAATDERVAAACFVEGYSFRTRGFYLRYPKRYFERARWIRLAARRVPKVLHRLPGAWNLGRYSAAFAGQDEVFVRDYPEPAALRRDYDAMNARGVHQLFVYVGGDSAFNHERQFLEFTGQRAFARTQRLVFLPKADHTLFRVADRADVVARICDWMERDVSPTRPT
ncbi:MAG TPA: hypothetical protein VGH28_21720 [Polyangiaceae bacterium]|jgi:dienelactone hydrolase